MSIPLIPAPAHLELLGGDPYVVPEGGLGVSSYHGDDPTDESYTLEVTAQGVTVRAAGPRGAAAASATVLQVMGLTNGTIPALRIEDAPRYAWRGVMIDVARHFFDVATLRRVVDLAQLYRLNRLHLHLTDDQGWRLPVAGRPELTEVSGPHDADGGAGGSYSQDEIAGLIAYAAQRGIALVPEVDLPGHTNAALHATPALNPDGVAPPAYAGTDVGFSTLRLELAETPVFLDDVVAALATAAGDSPFLHVGGDEVRELDPREYDAFVQHVERVVVDAGRRAVVWQEAARALADPTSVVQLWDLNQPVEPVVAAAERGHEIVLSPAPHAYLDMQYEPDHPLGLHWAGYVDVRDAYDWDPATLVPGLPADRVLGVEAAIWTETIRTPDELFSMLLPRLAATAEVAWSQPDVRDWEAFVEDLAAHETLWRAHGFAFERREQVFGSTAS